MPRPDYPHSQSLRSGLCRFLIACALVSASWMAQATNHILRINEVLGGLNGDATAQFVEIVTAGSSQKLWGPNNGAVGRAMLVFFDETGAETGRFVFGSNAPSGNDTVLVATQAFAEASGMTPDFVMPALVTPTAGKVCFKSNPPATGEFSVNLCLSYGGARYTGDTENASSANPAELPISGSLSLSRVTDFLASSNSNASFGLASLTPSSTATPGADDDLEQKPTGSAGRLRWRRRPRHRRRVPARPR